jgi:predicted  nucleic acid-binding Zn-ribbon protein
LPVQEQLRALFSLDQQIRGLRSRVDAAGRRLSVHRSRLEQQQRQSQELADQIKHAKTASAALANDAAGLDERIEKIRQTMANVRSNKEYSALLVEVNTLKADRSGMEDQELEHLTRIEELEARAGEIDAKVADQQKLVDQAEAEVTEGKAEIADQLTNLEQERDAAAEPIADDTLTLYRKLADDNDGEALAEIEEQDRRRMEYTCGACFMSLPIQTVNAALTSTDQPVVCPSCGRILYVADSLKEALVPNK